MSRLVVVGDPIWVEGFALAGATVLPATDADAVRAAWEALPEDAGVLVMTADAADALGDALPERPYLLSVVIPS
jgi:vacuolar-type H+-ATPase subunit F/Vma7